MTEQSVTRVNTGHRQDTGSQQTVPLTKVYAVYTWRRFGHCVGLRAQKLCASRGGLLVLNSPDGLCGRETTLNLNTAWDNLFTQRSTRHLCLDSGHHRDTGIQQALKLTKIRVVCNYLKALWTLYGITSVGYGTNTQES